MAETLISPGVLARENDQSQVTSQPVQAGACLVGPTVLGRVGIPKLVTTYSEYLSSFGSTFASGSNEYSYFTSISAFNYFNNGGTSLIINRVASGSWTQANTTLDPIRNDIESGNLTPAPWSFTGSMGATAQFGTAFSNTAAAAAPYASTIFNVNRDTKLGSFTSNVLAKPLKASVAANITPVATGNYTAVGTGAVPITVGTNSTALFDIVIANNDYTDVASTVVVNTAGSGYKDGEVATIAEGALGAGFFKLQANTTNIDNSTLVGTDAPAQTLAAVFTGGTGTGAEFTVDTIKAGTLAPVSTQTTGLSSAAVAAGSYDAGSSSAITITDGMTSDANAEGGTVTVLVDGTGAVASIDIATGASTGYVTLTGTITLSQSDLVAAGLVVDATGGSLIITLTNANINTIVEQLLQQLEE